LCTQVRLPKPQVCYTFDSLYPTFVGGLSAIYSVDNVTDTFVFPEWILQFFKERFRTFPNLFYKVTTFFLFCQVLCELFFNFFLRTPYEFRSSQLLTLRSRSLESKTSSPHRFCSRRSQDLFLLVPSF